VHRQWQQVFFLKDSSMKKFVIALAVAAALPMGAQAADNISYNYAEVDYVTSHNDVPDDADGWGLKASVAVLPNMHVFGDFNRQTLDDSKLDIDTWRVGVGYNRAINEATDVVARLAYQQQDREVGHHQPGLSAEVGLNTAYGEHMQVYGALGWEDYTRTKGINPKGEFFGRLGMLAKLNQNWSVNASLKYDVDGNIEVQAGPRFSW
jgi:Ax21 family sulfation-dependent quorum factor